MEQVLHEPTSHQNEPGTFEFEDIDKFVKFPETFKFPKLKKVGNHAFAYWEWWNAFKFNMCVMERFAEQGYKGSLDAFICNYNSFTFPDYKKHSSLNGRICYLILTKRISQGNRIVVSGRVEHDRPITVCDFRLSNVYVPAGFGRQVLADLADEGIIRLDYECPRPHDTDAVATYWQGNRQPFCHKRKRH